MWDYQGDHLSLGQTYLRDNRNLDEWRANRERFKNVGALKY